MTVLYDEIMVRYGELSTKGKKSWLLYQSFGKKYPRSPCRYA